MFREEKSQNKFFKVKCANMEIMTLEQTSEEAAASALKSLIERYGENARLSLIISVDEIRDTENEITVFYTSQVLENIGYFTLAKNVESLSDFFLDKGKNCS